MKSKEDVKTMIDQAPASRAYNASHSTIANTAVGWQTLRELKPVKQKPAG